MSSRIWTLDAAYSMLHTHQTAESPNFLSSLNLLGPGGIEFDVPQGPVRLSAKDFDLLPDMSSSIEGLTIF